MEIFIENTSGLELAEVCANLQRILRGNRALVRGLRLVRIGRVWTSGPNPASELGPEPLLLAKGLLSSSDVPRAVSAATSLRLGPSTSHLSPGPSASPRGLCPGTCRGTPVPLSPLPYIDPACWKPTSLSQLSHGGTCSVEGASSGSRGMFGAQLLPPLAGRPTHLKHKCHRRVKLSLETSRLSQ